MERIRLRVSNHTVLPKTYPQHHTAHLHQCYPPLTAISVSQPLTTPQTLVDKGVLVPLKRFSLCAQSTYYTQTQNWNLQEVNSLKDGALDTKTISCQRTCAVDELEIE